MEIILTHSNADFDAVASLLAAHKLFPAAVPVLPKTLNSSVAEFVTLYQNGLPFVQWDDMSKHEVERIILVDTQRLPDMRKLNRNVPIIVIDHHPEDDELEPNMIYEGEEVGAATTLLIERLQQSDTRVQITSLEATLLALGIYADTGSLTYGTTTPRDILAAAWTLEHHAVLDTVRRFLSPPLNEEQLKLLDELLEASHNRMIQGYTVTVSAARADEYIEQVNSVAYRLRSMLDADAIFVLVHMDDRIQMVARSRTDAIDVGEIARHFGGGGHNRAAAASIRADSLQAVEQRLWDYLETTTKPKVRVADLMSYGVQTVDADQRLEDIIVQLRRIGHEGFPVVDGKHIVGLLTRRDADRALEHRMGTARVRDVMLSGAVSLMPDASVTELEQVMVQSGWGQIPVVDETGELLGIVTRTDLIKHWADVHPPAPVPERRVEPQQFEQVLGQPAAELIEKVAQYARDHHISMYLVGGVVRDLLLERANYDLDFVIEGDAIQFAREIRHLLRGEVKSHSPFGTAKLILETENTYVTGSDVSQLPSHIDFATARNEFYEHPTALPSVYSSSIKLDLHRRDFTINTLAIQLSPARASNRILDFYGGLHDLDNRLIRVLHSLSFVDDPTRVLRAVRFEQRLGFTIEARTAELISNSLPMLNRITGERLQNELTLLFREQLPEAGLLAMHERGILSAIHESLTVDTEDIKHMFPVVRQSQEMWPVQTDDLPGLYWHIWLSNIELAQVKDVCERLGFGRHVADSIFGAAELIQAPGVLAETGSRVSEMVKRLNAIPEMALLVGGLVGEGVVRERIGKYINEWRYNKPVITGHTLRQMGLSPGPRYKIILERLMDARLDGEVTTDEDERRLLIQLIEETS